MHKGEYVKSIVAKMGISTVDLAKITCLSRGTIYGYYNDQNLGRKQIELIGQAINFDFSKIFGDYSDIDTIKIEDSKKNNFKSEPRQIKITVELDGNEINLEKMIKKLKAMNEALRKL